MTLEMASSFFIFANMKTVHLEISGRVQGVFFRASAKEIAESYNISGWIRNTPRRTVEASVTGEDEDVLRFIEWCKQGPQKARVEHVSITETRLQTFEGFDVIR